MCQYLLGLLSQCLWSIEGSSIQIAHLVMQWTHLQSDVVTVYENIDMAEAYYAP